MSQTENRPTTAGYRVFIPCVPPAGTAQQKGVFVRNGKPKFFTKRRLLDAKKELTTLFTPHAPAQRFAGPIRVRIIFRYPWRAGEAKAIKAMFSSYPIKERPDVENVAKLALDVLTGCGYWEDDSQISTLIASKYRGDMTGIEITIDPEEGTKRNEITNQIT